MNAVDFLAQKKLEKQKKIIESQSKPFKKSEPIPIINVNKTISLDEVLYRPFKKEKNKTGKGSVLVPVPDYEYDSSNPQPDRKVVAGENKDALIKYIKQQAKKINLDDY